MIWRANRSCQWAMAAGLRVFLYRLTSVSLRPGKQAAIVAKVSAGTAQCIHHGGYWPYIHIRVAAPTPSFRIEWPPTLPTCRPWRFATGDSPNGEDNSTRCPGVQHYHRQHHDVGFESSARDGLPWQQRALEGSQAPSVWNNSMCRREHPGASPQADQT